jgi:hypothetical protein
MAYATMKYGVIKIILHCIVSVVIRLPLQADKGKGCSIGVDIHYTVYIPCSLPAFLKYSALFTGR